MGVGTRVAALQQAALLQSVGLHLRRCGMAGRCAGMGVMGGIGGGTEEVWPYDVGEVQDTPKKESVGPPLPAT
jgi:hypothetical protein